MEKKARRTTPLRPDGEGIYRFVDGSYVELLLEHDTETEHMSIIKNKLRNYGDHIGELWGQSADLVNVLFVTKTNLRALKIRSYWKWYLKEWFRNRKVPTLWFTHENLLNEPGVLSPIWLGTGEQLMAVNQFPRLKKSLYSAGAVLGKQAGGKLVSFSNSRLRAEVNGRVHDLDTLYAPILTLRSHLQLNTSDVYRISLFSADTRQRGAAGPESGSGTLRHWFGSTILRRSRWRDTE